MEICHRHVKSSHEAYLNSKRIVGLVLFCPVLLLKSFRTISCPYITLSLVPQRLAKLKLITSFFYSRGSCQLIFNGMLCKLQLAAIRSVSLAKNAFKTFQVP